MDFQEIVGQQTVTILVKFTGQNKIHCTNFLISVVKLQEVKKEFQDDFPLLSVERACVDNRILFTDSFMKKVKFN